MKVLVGWDSAHEAEIIELLLNVGDVEARAATTVGDFVAAASNSLWDVIVMALDFPSAGESFALFETIRARQAETPILGLPSRRGCASGAVYVARTAQFPHARPRR